jgi:hypothetical protein
MAEHLLTDRFHNLDLNAGVLDQLENEITLLI